MREFLKGLELDKETIDTIMAEHGKIITETKEKVSQLEDQIREYDQKIAEYESNVKEKDESLQNLQQIEDENKQLKTQIQMSDSNVKKEFSKFVTSEIMSQVNEDNDFATVLESYKKENPQYFGDSVVKKVQSSPTLTGGDTRPQTTNDIMNNLLRGTTQENN